MRVVLRWAEEKHEGIKAIRNNKSSQDDKVRISQVAVNNPCNLGQNLGWA